jgi:hypothetical protein
MGCDDEDALSRDSSVRRDASVDALDGRADSTAALFDSAGDGAGDAQMARNDAVDDSRQPADVTGADRPNGCAPRTCAQAAAECGAIDDRCGAMIDCGSCVDPLQCAARGGANRCERPDPLPYPTRNAYRIKSLQPDFWPNADEISGNNTGGVAMNLVWDVWEPTRRAPPCGPDIEFDGRCFVLDRAVDDAIAMWTARSLVVTAVVYGSPAYARVPGCTPVAPGYERFCAPIDANDFGRFVRMIARRYDGHHTRGRIADFVIWNEVNSNDWFDIGCGQASGACNVDQWVRSYANVYNAAFDAVAIEQPTARVLYSFEHHFGSAFDSPGAASPVLGAETMMLRLAPLVAPRAWRVAFHPYAPDLLRPQFSPDDWPRVTYGNIGTLLGWLHSNFAGIPSTREVELTESGINSVAPNSSPAAQSTAICDTFRNVLGTPGIDNYVYHRMTDHPAELAGGLGLGLRNADRSAKPAWSTWALANRSDLMPPMLSCGFEDVPYTRLRRSFHATRGHWASTRLAPAGFTVENSWRLWRDSRPDTTLLFECRVGAVASSHNLLSRDPRCEGLQPLGPVGYIHNGPVAGATALYRCRVMVNGDHFVSTQANCEGQVFEQLLGYAP